MPPSSRASAAGGALCIAGTAGTAAAAAVPACTAGAGVAVGGVTIGAGIAAHGAGTAWTAGQAIGTIVFANRAVAAKTASGLSDDVVRLAERNITNSGDTVLGHFPGYITKANSKGASSFDIGDAWNGPTPTQRWAANTRFLDTRIAAGDRVLLSVREGDIRPGSYLAQEVRYLTNNRYRWTNQRSLVPRG